MEKRQKVDLSIFVGKRATLCQYLESNPDVDLTRLRDEKKNSVLHITAYENKFELMRVLLDHVEKVEKNRIRDDNEKFPVGRGPVKEIIQDLINEKNVQGYTAMHYASLRGNVEMMKYLEKMGGSILIVTKSRLNLVHSAAQGDALASLLYLQSRFRLNFNDKDYSLSTALHWACYFGSESIVEFLLAQPQVIINERDSDGQTPLHIAVLNSRPAIVKRLLIKGANRNLINKREQTPLQISEHLQLTSISKMLDNQYTCSDNMMFYYSKKRKYQPESSSCTKPFMFVGIYLFVAAGSHLLYVPKFQMLYVYISAGVHLFIILIYLSLLLPAPRRQQMDYKTLINNLPICSECRAHKNDRMYHCDICERCISNYDHHCPWINGCVGRHNIKRFVTFLMLLLTVMLLNAFLEVIGIFKLQIVFQQFRYFGMHQNAKQYFEIGYIVILSMGLLVVVIFFILASGLLCNQIRNIFYNTTTYERSAITHKKVSFKGSSSGKTVNSDSIQQPLFDKKRKRRRQEQCSFRNCGLMCCATEVEQNYV